MTEQNELERTVSLALAKDGVTMEQVLMASAGGHVPTPAKAEPKAPATLPKKVAEAFDRVKKTWNKIVIDTARKLTTQEIEGLLEEGKGLTETRLAVSKREKIVKEYFVNHINALPEAVNAPRDANGNAILAQPGEPFVIDTIMGKVTQTYVKGAVTVNVPDLEAMVESGDLTKHQYWAMTNKVEYREFNPEKALELVRKNPSLLGKITQATTNSPPRSSLKFN